MSNGTLRVLPLGGLGEIGKNMTVVEYDGRIVVVDVGLRFPTAEMLGIDLVLPDFAYLRERADDIEAIVVTHGHEDHLGALPFVLRELGRRRPPVYGGPLTMAMARSKLDEHKLQRRRARGRRRRARSSRLGPFDVELIHMTHSIPDASAVALHTELGTVLVTGDYKFDQTPVDGVPADIAAPRRARPRGRCCCSAATRRTPTARASRRQRVGRRPAPRGGLRPLRGPHRRHELRLEHPPRPAGRRRRRGARPQGRARRPLDAQEREHRPLAGPHRRARGHPRPAARDRRLPRPQARDHLDRAPRASRCARCAAWPTTTTRRSSCTTGDTVVFSATPIPGNERAVNETIDRLYHIGCDVITTARRADPRLRPRLRGGDQADAQPRRGRATSCRSTATSSASACTASSPSRSASTADDIFQGENGLPLEIDAAGARFGEPRAVGHDLRRRRRHRRRRPTSRCATAACSSADGIFVVVATISEQDGSSVAEPEVIFRGVPFPDEAEELLDEIRDTVDASLERAAEEEIREIDLLQQVLHDDLAAFVYDRLKRRPMVLPVVVEV